MFCTDLYVIKNANVILNILHIIFCVCCRLAKEENIRDSDSYMKYVVPSQQDQQQHQPPPQQQPHQQHQGQQTKGLIVRDASTNTDDLWQHTIDSESDNCTKCVPEV